MRKSAIAGGRGGVRCLMAKVIKHFHISLGIFPSALHPQEVQHYFRKMRNPPSSDFPRAIFDIEYTKKYLQGLEISKLC